MTKLGHVTGGSGLLLGQYRGAMRAECYAGPKMRTAVLVC